MMKAFDSNGEIIVPEYAKLAVKKMDDATNNDDVSFTIDCFTEAKAITIRNMINGKYAEKWHCDDPLIKQPGRVSVTVFRR